MTVTVSKTLVEQKARRLLEKGCADTPEQAREFAEIDCTQHEMRWEAVVSSRLAGARADDLDGALADAVEEWRREPWRNLILLGAVGTGKTHAAAAALRLAFDDDRTTAFYPVVELLDAMRPHGDPEAYERCQRVQYLALDDLGAERPTDWSAERLYALVNRRWLKEQTTIVTSNLSAAGGKGPFVDAVGPRMYSRLVHDAVVAQVAGADRRRAS